MRVIRRWILRRILRSALVFERASRGLYETLKNELGDPESGGIAHLAHEEEMHRRLLEDIVAGRLDDRALEEVLVSHRYHALDEIAPLGGAARAALGGKLAEALRDEEATVRFYENLARISTLGVARRAFSVLAEMEREHVDVLRRLLSEPPRRPPGGGSSR